MNLVSFADSLLMVYEKSSGQNAVLFEPFRPYVVTESQFHQFEKDRNISSLFYKITKLNSRVPNFNAYAQKPGKLFFYAGGGGYGDQIIAWPVARYLSNMGYQLDVYTDPGNESCWWMMPWIRSVGILPIPKTHFDNYTQYAVFTETTNMDEYPDQAHPVDTMFRKIGIDPATVPPEEKVLAPAFSPMELNRARSFLQSTGIAQTKFAFMQLSASLKLRSLPPAEAFVYMQTLAEAFPDIAWIHLTDKYNDAAYAIKIQESGLPNLYAHTFARLRDMWAATTLAELVVGVDSMAVHVAGSCGVPCVGIWGPVHPLTRVKYYREHTPLFDPSPCPFAPCFFAHGSDLPPFCPPNPPPTACKVMQASTPDKVLDAVRIIVNNKPNDPNH